MVKIWGSATLFHPTWFYSVSPIPVLLCFTTLYIVKQNQTFQGKAGRYKYRPRPLGRASPPCRIGNVCRFCIFVFNVNVGEMKSTRPGLYANMNRRKRLGISRPKSKSTVSKRVWRMMKAKKGGFAAQ